MKTYDIQLLALATLLPLLGVGACTSDPGSETPPTLSVGISLPTGEDLSSLGIDQVRVRIEGDDLEEGAYETTFSVGGDSGGSLGALPEVPFSDSEERQVVAEGLTEGGAVMARAASLPMTFAAGEEFSVDLLLAPVNEFMLTAPYVGEGRTEMHVPRIGHTTTLLVDGRVMVTGGLRRLNAAGEIPDDGLAENLLESIEIYDPGDGKWYLSTSELRVPRAYHTATRLRGSKGTVLVLGGYGSVNERLSSLRTGEVVYPHKLGSEDAVLSLQSYMESPRARHTATLHPAGWVLIAGGENRSDIGAVEVVDEVEMFFAVPPDRFVQEGLCSSASSRSWTFCRTPDLTLNTARYGHGAAVVGTDVVVFGGTDGQASLDSSERISFDSSGDALPTAPARGPLLQKARHDMAWVTYQDRIFVFGGATQEAGSPARTTSSIEWYTPTPVPAFAEARFSLSNQTANAAAALVGTEGWAIVAGGRDRDGTSLSGASLIQLSENGLERAPVSVDGPLEESRFGHGMLSLWNDQVLVTGGARATQDGAFVSHVTLKSAEVFTPGPEQLSR